MLKRRRYPPANPLIIPTSQANACRPLFEQPDDQALRPVNTEEQRLQERAQMFVCLRHDMERVRNLCYLIVRREKIKRQLAAAAERTSCLQLKLTRKNKWLRRLRPEDWRHLAGAHIGETAYENQSLLRSLLPAPEAVQEEPATSAAAESSEAIDVLDAAADAVTDPDVRRQEAATGGEESSSDCLLDPSAIRLTEGDYRRLGRERRDGLCKLPVVDEAAELMATATAAAGAPRRQVARRRRRRREEMNYNDGEEAATGAPQQQQQLTATAAASTQPKAVSTDETELRRALRQLPARALRVSDEIQRRLRAGLRVGEAAGQFCRLIVACPSSSDDEDDEELAAEERQAAVAGATSTGKTAAMDSDGCAEDQEEEEEEEVADAGEPTPTPPPMVDEDEDDDEGEGERAIEGEKEAEENIERAAGGDNGKEVYSEGEKEVDSEGEMEVEGEGEGEGETNVTVTVRADKVDAPPASPPPPELSFEHHSSGNLFEKLSKA